MKNKFLLAFLFLGLLTLNFSCEEESVQVNDEFTLLNHGENKFIQWNNINELPIVNQHLSKLNKQNLQSKSGSNNFTFIEGSRIYVYTDSTEITYTIPIQKEYQLKGTYSNLVIKTIDNNTVESFILNYTPTQEHIEQYANYNQTPYQGTVEYEPLYDEQSPDTQTAGRTTCTYITITYCNWGGSTHVANNCSPAYMWTETISVCSDSGGGSDDPWGGDPSEPTDVPSGGQDNGGGDDGTDTTPVLESCQELGTCLDDNQVILNCIGPDPRLSRLNDSQKSDIADYIINNRCSIEAQEFTILAIDAFEDRYEVKFEDQIINELEGKAKCIYDKLTSSNTEFKNAIKKFDGEFPVSHLKFEEENLADNTRGRTIPPGHSLNPNPFLILIQLNNDSSNSGVDKRPNLLTVKTIIHEVIHAEMFRKMLSLAGNNGNIDTVLLNTMLQNGDYPGMLDYYTRFGINGFQHQQMAVHYRDKIARVLQEFDTGIVVADNQLPQQLYLDLAWEGLNHSNIVAWQQAISQQERDRIDQVIVDYINQHSNEICTE